MEQLNLDQHRISQHELKDYPEFISALLKVKLSAADTNQRDQKISPEVAANILKCARELLSSKNYEAFTADPYSGGGGILLNRQMNTILSERAQVPIEAVNLSQSTADTCMTAFRLALHTLVSANTKVLEETIKLLQRNATKFQQTKSMSRTCLQDALPSTLGVLFEGYAELLKRRKMSLEVCQRSLLFVNLGGTVIGSGEGASENYRTNIIRRLSEENGLPLLARENFYDAAQNSDDVAALGQELETTARALIKICKDLRLLASGPEHGLNEIVLPKIISGSTFFTSKNNPTIPETVIQGAFLILGKAKIAQLAFEHSELNLNVFEFAGDFALYEALEVLKQSLHIMNQHCLANITASTKDRP